MEEDVMEELEDEDERDLQRGQGERVIEWRIRMEEAYVCLC